MADERLEMLRRANAEFNEHGVTDRLLAIFHPDCETVAMPGWPEDAVYRGVDGAREALTQWQQAMRGFHIDIDELFFHGERVLSLGHVHWRTGDDVEMTGQEFAQLIDFRDGLIVRQQFWFSWEEARAAAGPGA
jgi:hypothetical protein